MNPVNGNKYAVNRTLRNRNTRGNTRRNNRTLTGNSTLRKSTQRRYPNIYANNARLSNRTRKVVKNVRNSIIAGEKLDPKFNSYMRRVIQEELMNEPVNLSAFNYL